MDLEHLERGTECECRYAQIEKELLAIVYRCEKFHLYVYGRDIQVEREQKNIGKHLQEAASSSVGATKNVTVPSKIQRVTYKPGK